MVAWRPFFGVLWLLSGCPKVEVSTDDAARIAALQASDRAWSARGTAGFDPVEAALDSVPSSQIDHPDRLWRVARLNVGRGLTQDDARASRRTFAVARDAAIRCLLPLPGVLGAQREGSLPAAMGRIDVARAPCAAWAGVAWTRWYLTLDPETASLDFPAVVGLLSRGRQAPPPSGQASSYGLILLEASRPDRAGEARTAAIAALEDAASDHRLDDAWVRWEDVVRVHRRPSGVAPGRAPATPEERGAVRRLTKGLLYRQSNLERVAEEE